MIAPLIYALPGAETAARTLTAHLEADLADLEVHRFPDGESGVRLARAPAGADAVLVAALRDPDPQALPLLFAADVLRELGAPRVWLAAPYLPYMRQDARFRPGEAITSRSFARFVDAAFDGLVTVDPHLHRHPGLDAVYQRPAVAVASAPAIARWLKQVVPSPCIVGPDAESRQWVAEVAGLAGCPYVVLEKQRLGDRAVEISVPQPQALLGRRPVLIDDIVSSGHTMAAAARQLVQAGHGAPLCIAVHALFDAQAADLIAQTGAHLVTCNTLRHPTNGIDVMPDLAQALRGLLASD